MTLPRPEDGIPQLAPTEAPSAEESRLVALEREVVAHLFRLSPSGAVALGIHSYDGLLPDLTPRAVEEWVKGSRRFLERLAELDPAVLSRDRRLDRTLLRLRLMSELFGLVEYPYVERLPLLYVSPLELNAYSTRPYAPAQVRAEAMVRVLEGAPALLKVGTDRLSGSLPAPFVEIGLAMAGGLAPHFEETEAFVAKEAPRTLAAYRRARAEAEGAVAAFLDHLRTARRRATKEFALGPQLFQRLLYVIEGSREPWERLLLEGTKNLRANQRRMEELAHARRPPTEVAPFLADMNRDHPSAESLLPETRGFVEEIRKFLLERDLVTVPRPEHCRVEATPPMERAWTFASLNSPGPFDTEVHEGIYYVTPVEPDWDADRKEQWLAAFNRPTLRNVTVHEVYPGHYVQFLHFRASTGTLARRVFFSSAFCEGWAHYTEQMMIEQGYGGGAPEAELAQLMDALLRNIRLVVSIRMHAQGMGLEEATELFVREAHMDRYPAEREALRGTFNPEYFGYTLGKLSILRARQAYFEQRPRATLKEFHDRILSFGVPPVGLLEPLLLDGEIPAL
jgi:uncharacterized protein (DUF885 family)